MKRHSIQACTAHFRHGWRTSFSARSDIVTMAIIYMMLLMVFGAVYRIMPVHELGHPSITGNHLLWYLAVTELILIAMRGNEREMGYEIADGQLTTMLRRPGNMMALLQARLIGNVMGNLCILSVVACVLLAVIGGRDMPMHSVHLPFFVLSVILGVMIMLTMGYMVGMIEVHGPYSRSASWIVNKFIFTFGGLFFPVMFFPEWLQHVVYLTPGPAILFIPGRFMLDPSWTDIIQGLAIQIGWMGILLVLAHILETRMVRHVLTVGD